MKPMEMVLIAALAMLALGGWSCDPESKCTTMVIQIRQAGKVRFPAHPCGGTWPDNAEFRIPTDSVDSETGLTYDVLSVNNQVPELDLTTATPNSVTRFHYVYTGFPSHPIGEIFVFFTLDEPAFGSGEAYVLALSAVNAETGFSDSTPAPTFISSDTAYWLSNGTPAPVENKVIVSYRPPAGHHFVGWAGAGCRQLTGVQGGLADQAVVGTVELNNTVEDCVTTIGSAADTSWPVTIRVEGGGHVQLTSGGTPTGELTILSVPKGGSIELTADESSDRDPIVQFVNWKCEDAYGTIEYNTAELSIAPQGDTTCTATFVPAIRVVYDPSAGTVMFPEGATPDCGGALCVAKWAATEDTTIVAVPNAGKTAKFSGICDATGLIPASRIGSGTCTVTFTAECPALGLALTWDNGDPVDDQVPGNEYLGADIIDVDPSAGTGVLRLQVTGLDPDERPSIVFYELIERATGEQPFASTGEDYADREISTMLPGARANRAEVNADCGTVMVPSIQFRLPSL